MSSCTCPHCHATRPLNGIVAGESVSCPACGRWFDPAPQEEEPVLDEEAERLREAVNRQIQSLPVIDKYEIGEEIAKGGMGRIHRAHDPVLRRDVALKRISGSPQTRHRARLYEEAQVTGQLEHPNIVPVHDMGLDAEGNLFFAMKMIRGRSLDQVLDGLRDGQEGLRERYSLPRLLHMLEQVCNALAFAHSHGVIHRDMKPGNIMLGDFGEVLVMDWGLAKLDQVRYRPTPEDTLRSAPVRASRGRDLADLRALDQDHAHRPIHLPDAIRALRNDSRLWGTRHGMIAGTPTYMSPEQARGDASAVDERCDIYSLGAILYEILTLHPPFLAPSESEIVRAVVEGGLLPPRLRAPSRRIPPVLDAIAMKALRRNPEERYRSVLDFQRDLRGFLDSLTIFQGEENFWQTLLRLSRHYKGASFLAGLVTAGVILWGVNSIRTEAELRRRAEERIRYAEQAEINQRLYAQKYLEEARVKYQDNRIDEAIHSLELATAFNPNLLEARMLRAQLLELRQDYEAALEEINEYLSRNPANETAQRMAERYRGAIRQITGEGDG